MELKTFSTTLALASGETLTADLVYAVYGELNAGGDNLVLFPTRYGGTHEHNDWLIGEARALDPRKYCIVVPNQLGNGVSSSPSNSAGVFPRISHTDNFEIQRQLIEAEFGGADIALAVGWSMGAQQACHWAVRAPERVKRMLMFCGTAKTRPHNRVFLEGLLAAFEADPRYRSDDSPLSGLRAAGRIYAGWAYSQPWLKAERYREMGFETLDDWLEKYWDALFEQRNADDLTSMIHTWIGNDIADGGDLAEALAKIKARSIVMATTTDLYFTPEDCAEDAAMIPGAEFRAIESDWGHMAGSGQSEPDNRVIDAAVRDLLTR